MANIDICAKRGTMHVEQVDPLNIVILQASNCLLPESKSITENWNVQTKELKKKSLFHLKKYYNMLL